MLRELFSNFDKSCLRNRCYKVCTIGDCYVAIGFDDSRKRNPLQEAKNLIELGLEMVAIIEDIRKKINYDGLDMRIGIHTVFFLIILLCVYLGIAYWRDHWNGSC